MDADFPALPFLPAKTQVEREYWSDLLLEWMGQQPLDGALQQGELLRALAGALAGEEGRQGWVGVEFGGMESCCARWRARWR